MEHITQAALKELMDYDPLTGVFTYRNSRKGRGAGTQAGSVANSGYRVMVLGGKSYTALRLAWLYVHGTWPSRNVKPKNGVKDDCRLENLHVTTAASHNDRRQGVRGAYRDYDLKKKFGLSMADYQRMFAAQGGVCAVCEKPETATRGGEVKWLAVDHCHDTGAVRGLLCQSCNLMVGYGRDDAAVLTAGAAYLRRHAAAPAADNVVTLRSA